MNDLTISDSEISEMLMDSLKELGITDDTPSSEDESTRKILSLEVEIEELKKERDEYKENYLQFKGIFQKQTRMFYDYQNLTPAIKNELDSIYRGETFEEFLVCGVQTDNIYALWDFMLHTLKNPQIASTEDFIILRKMLDYFVRLYNCIYPLPVLSKMDVSAGNDFNPVLHTEFEEHIEPPTEGTIQVVLLPGLVNSITNTVIRPSIVKI